MDLPRLLQGPAPVPHRQRRAATVQRQDGREARGGGHDGVGIAASLETLVESSNGKGLQGGDNALDKPAPTLGGVVIFE